MTGRKLRYEGFPPDVLRARSEDMAAMFKWFDSTGYAADIKSLRTRFLRGDVAYFRGVGTKAGLECS